ncbi:MAG: folate family ECF transporter S component [Lachnospiraceae bacterium]|nr:folate family ECF transporter S component [Lachnospiraceae bacterium]
MSNRFQESLGELKKIQVLTACAMLGALAVILGNFSVYLTPEIRVGFSTIPNQLVDYLFGPAAGAVFGGALDILKYLIKPSGAFFFGFTFSAIMAGLIYGLFFYKRKLSLPRILAAEGIVSLVVNIGLNSLWLTMLYGQALMVILPGRILKNLVMWPINSLIYYFLVRLLGRTGVLNGFLSAGAGKEL